MFNQTRVRILECNWTVIGDHWEGLDIYSSFWRIYINKCDGASVELPGKGRLPLRGGTVYIIPAWVRFLTHTGRPVDHFYIHFDLPGMNDMVMKGLFDHLFTLKKRVHFDELIRNLGIRRDERKKTLGFTCRIKAMIFEGLAELIEKLPEESQRLMDQAIVSRNRFSEVLHYIESHPMEDLGNPRLARMTHMSLSHFVRTFKQAVGQPPAVYVLQQRISKAAKDLVVSSAKIDDIAQQCGFANRFHFSRHFKRIMGVSPGAYRKTTRA
jgi:AraC-like DNA-binding protein